MNIKTFLAICILFVGVVGFLYIMGSVDEPADRGDLLGVVVGGRDSSRFDFERSGDLGSFERPVNFSAPSFLETPNEKSVDEDNITNQAINSYREEIFRMNRGKSGGVSSESPITMPGSKVVSDIIEKSLGRDLDVELFEMDDIRIGDDTLEGVEKYLTGLEESYEKNIGGLEENFLTSVAKAVGDQGDGSLRRQADGLVSQISAGLALRAPESWAVFHLEMLNVWQKKLAVANSILDIDDDPLGTMVALRELENIHETEIDILGALESLD